MDDTGPKSTASQSNIDELVKELSRPQSSMPSSTGSIPNASAPSVGSVPPRPTPPASAMGSMPQPSKPSVAPAPAPVKPVAPTAPKEYQSSIRTMNEDLSKLKAGQQPQGVNVPRKIDNTPAPEPVKSVTPAAPFVPAKPAPSPSMPSTIRSAPMAPSPKSTTPQAPITRPVAPSMPSTVKVPDNNIIKESQAYVPEIGTKASKTRAILFGSIALVAIVFGGLYWYLLMRDTTPDIVDTVATFTPRPSPTQNPDQLAVIFPSQYGSVVLPASGDPVVAFRNATAQLSLVSGGFLPINITSGASVSAQTLTITSLLDRFVAQYPSEFKTSLGTKYRFLLYGQKESFDSKGLPVATSAISSRLVMVSEIASSSATILRAWESTMTSSLANVMSIDVKKNKGPVMSTNYRTVDVRFKNFPYPDRSIDYGIVSHNGKSYLVIAGSREAMFATVDAFANTPK